MDLSISLSESRSVGNRMLLVHMSIIQKLLGFAKGSLSQDATVVPEGTDGTDLAGKFWGQEQQPVVTATHSIPEPSNGTEQLDRLRQIGTALIIEYTSLGDVVPYQHLEEHTFVAPRLHPTAGQHHVCEMANTLNIEPHERTGIGTRSVGAGIP